MAWNLGFLSAAGAGAGAYELISTTVLSSTAASVSFSSIDQTYKHLQIRMAARGTSASFDVQTRLRLNTDSAGNYARHALYGDGSSVISFANTAQTGITVAWIPDSSNTANAFAGTVIDVLDYASSSKNTTVRSLTGQAATNNSVVLASGLWLNTAAVSQVDLLPLSGSFAIGSRFSLYGIK